MDVYFEESTSNHLPISLLWVGTWHILSVRKLQQACKKGIIIIIHTL